MGADATDYEAKKPIPELFRYSEVALPADCYHRISPSQIEKFFSYPRLYHDENIKGSPSQFQGNTATVTGTVCHHIYKEVTLGRVIESRDVINKQLAIYNELKPELNLDIVDIENTWPQICNCVVNEYLLKPEHTTGIIKCEEKVLVKVAKDIYLGGTYDRLEGDCVVDFKTVGKLPDQDKIPFGYKIQLLAYAYALRMMGYIVNRVRIVYGVKPTKTIGARCIVVTEEIDFVADKLIGDTLKLIAESVAICRDNPSLNHLIFKSMDLKVR